MTTSRELVEKYEMEYFEVEGNTVDRTWDIYEKRKKVVVKYTATNINFNFYAVQFKIENWNGSKVSIPHNQVDFGWCFVRLDDYKRTASHTYLTLKEPSPLYIGRDAQDQWSTPVIFNREQQEKLLDLVEYLEDKLNAS